MDLISGLKSELFRPLVTLFVPGAVAVAPYILVVQSKIPQAAQFWHDHPSAFVAVVLIAIVAAGLLLEDIGSRLELSIWEPRLKPIYPKLDEEWHQYLALNTQDEIIGQRYLRTIVIRMKFELAMSPALFIHLLGLNWLNARMAFLSSDEMLWVIALLPYLAFYVAWESYYSARTLARIRQDVIRACELVSRHGKVEKPAAASATTNASAAI